MENSILFFYFIFETFPYSPEYKYRCEGEMTKGNEDKILNGLAYNPNIHNEEGPHIYISCNLQN